MNFYCIYDNLYEEYQMPFTMKNDNIAKLEFEMFVNNAVDKAPEKEKGKTRNRFMLCRFKGIEYNQNTGAIFIAKYASDVIQAEIITGAEDNE